MLLQCATTHVKSNSATQYHAFLKALLSAHLKSPDVIGEGKIRTLDADWEVGKKIN